MLEEGGGGRGRGGGGGGGGEILISAKRVAICQKNHAVRREVLKFVQKGSQKYSVYNTLQERMIKKPHYKYVLVCKVLTFYSGARDI